MIPKLVTLATVALLLAGCGDDPQPTRRTIADQSDQADPHGGETNPHGSAPNPHGGMAGQTSRPAATGPQVSLGAMVMTAPDGWQRKQASSQFLLAEFSLPQAEGDTAGGRLTVTGVGGTVAANVERWKGQFGGNPTDESQETKEIGGVSVAMVSLSGTFADQHAMGGPVTQRPGYRMRAAIFHVGSQQFIIKCVGPKKTMANSEGAFTTFIESLKRPEPPSTKPGPAKPESPPTPDATKPDATKPDATEPDATEPDATEPDATEPETP
ncbi:MAG: hypothetical protein HQ567_30225 [Candidatus Nealsonbacteria bacterium]|nr:hypothetical protein [Candidatus Nealsonbacteria bacterium]